MSQYFECQAKQIFRKHFELSSRNIDINSQPKVRDEVISIFISAMIGHSLKRWEGIPCIQRTAKTSVIKKKKHKEKHNGENIESELIKTDVSNNKTPQERNTDEAGLPDQAKDYNDLDKDGTKSTFSIKNILTNPFLVSEILTDPDLNAFINDWKFCEADQLVNMEFKNENRYIGRLSRSVMHGEGEFHWADGTVYKGEFDNGIITGRGKLEWQTQTWYEGDFLHGYRHGYGVLMVPELLTYIGQWVHGKRHGKGLLIYYNSTSTKSLFEVNWVNGVASGKGFRSYPSGAQYDGEWEDGIPHGYGTMIWPNGDTYIGNWVNGKKEGIGTYIWCGALTNDFSAPSRNSYFGMWKASRREGTGILDTINGAMVKGEWRNNIKMGNGVLVCKNGLQIEGNPLFSNDNMVLVPLPSNHAWNFMTLTDNYNILMYNYTLNKDLDGKDDNMYEQQSENIEHKAINEHKTSHTNEDQYKTMTFNPTLLPDEYIDLSYHINRLIKQRNVMEAIEGYNTENRISNIFEEFKTRGVRAIINRNTNPFHQYETYHYTKPIPFFRFESKWVRNVILRHLPYLRQLFQGYCGMLCKEIPKCPLLLPRLLLWQLLRDCVRHKVVLSELDIAAKNNPTSMVEDVNNPFEKLKFFQFLHYLMELSWQLYGKHTIGLESTPGVLGSALEKLIEDDIKPKAGNYSGSVLLLFPDLLPFHDLYNNLYCKYKIFTPRTLLNKVLALKPRSPLSYKFHKAEDTEKFIKPTQSNIKGKNIFGIGDRPVYEQIGIKSLIDTKLDKVIESFSQENIDSEQLQNNIDELDKVTEVEQCQSSVAVTRESTRHNDKTLPESKDIENDNKDDSEYSDLSQYSLNNIDIHTAIKCITKVCPLTKCGSKIVNMDAKITFLEVYEMLFLMGYKSLKIEAKQREEAASQREKKLKEMEELNKEPQQDEPAKKHKSEVKKSRKSQK